jgi:hypothetical protein
LPEKLERLVFLGFALGASLFNREAVDFLYTDTPFISIIKGVSFVNTKIKCTNDTFRKNNTSKHT